MPNIKKPQRMRSRQKLLTAVSEPHRREGRASVDKGSELWFSPSPGLCSAAKGKGPRQAPEAPDEKTVDTRSAGERREKQIKSRMFFESGGPGRARTSNQTVMSRRL